MNIRTWMGNFFKERKPSKRSFQIDEELVASLQEQADLERFSADELAANLLAHALQERRAMNSR